MKTLFPLLYRMLFAIFPALVLLSTGGASFAETPVDQMASQPSPLTLAKSQNPHSRQGVRLLLVARQEAMLSARFFGTITAIPVKEGDSFQKGERLVRFNCNELAADRAVASATLKLQKTTSRANAELHARQVVGELENNLSRIRVEEAAARTKSYTTKMRNCSIIAPFPGQVVSLEANEHESLQPGTPIMLIQNPSDLEVELHVPSSWLQWLTVGATFRAVIEEVGQSYEAVVDQVGVRIDPVSRTVKVYASIAGKHAELLPGMSGYAEFVSH